MRDGCCETCLFWVLTSHAITDDGDVKEGDCRRYPPTVLDVDFDPEFNAYHFQFNPSTSADFWCGEYRK
jgi:hypothetical protein